MAAGSTYMTNTFDADGRVEEQILTEGARYAFAYTEDSSGRITATEVTQPGGAVRRVAFDANGFGTSDTEAHGTDLARTTSYERDDHAEDHLAGHDGGGDLRHLRGVLARDLRPGVVRGRGGQVR
ncbi:hypothetical protein [Streptomyces parvus]|uniref:hypothetical protein n=1 Tax=Streptomyces parvus TaxID=66428 RepID=UPI0033FFF2C9